MSSNTPDRGSTRRPGDNDNDGDIHETIKASRQQASTHTRARDPQDSPLQQQQPLSFKRRDPEVQQPSSKRSSFSSGLNLFSKRTQQPARHLTMPPQPQYADHTIAATLSAQSTPTRRVSGKGKGGGDGRRVSSNAPRSTAARGIHQALGSTPNQRIQDWQRDNARSPMDAPQSPGLPEDANDRDNGLSGSDDDDDGNDEDASLLAGDDRRDEVPAEPILPQMLPGLKTPESQTPLPKIATIVLAISMVGEFLSASVGAPFLLPMLEDLGVPGCGGESAVGLWAGYVSAAFFLTQFATALLWANASVRFGRRAVLFTSLLGNTVMLLCYGTCKSVILMVVIRLFQGACNGALGVARSAIKDITDPTNEGRAYSVLGLCWSLGGIIGPILGVSCALVT